MNSSPFLTPLSRFPLAAERGRLPYLRWACLLGCVLLLGAAGPAGAQNFQVTSNADTGAVGTLRWALGQANAFGSAATIGFNAGLGTILLTGELPILKNAAGITINGNGTTIDGGSTSNTTGFRVFFIGVGAGEAAVSPGLTATTNTAWSISNLTIQNANARGGGGGGGGVNGDSGGGGAGLGGGIFVNAGSLQLSGVNFSNNRAIGGASGTSNTFYGGGGGMGGNGGSGSAAEGGGGGFGIGANGGSSSFNAVAGSSGLYLGGASGGAGGGGGSLPGGAGGLSGGGGGTSSPNGLGAGGGGVGGGSGDSSGNNGGAGGFGGGGGSGFPAGAGGFGGGGGSGGPDSGGAGGFGGGGGSGTGTSGAGGFGGGSALSSSGGGGLGAGGGLFVRQGASINILDGSVSGGIVQGGTGANNGQGLGSGLFLAGGATYSVSSGNTITLADTIGGGVDSQITGGFTKAGAGTLVLTGTNTFTGGVATKDFGTLAISTAAALGAVANGVTFTNGALRTDTAMTLNRALTISPGQVAFFNTNGNAVTLSGVVSGDGGFIKQGAGVLTLTNTSNSQANNRIDAGVLAISDNAHLGFSTGTLFLGGGTLRTDASITTSRPLVLQFGAASSIDTNGNTLTWNGAISDNGSLAKIGLGTLVLNGGNTYTGGTTVSGGTLAASAAGALGSTASIAVTGSGTLLLGGTGNRVSDTAPVSVNGSKISAEGLSSQSETLGSLTLSGASTLDFGTGTGDTLKFAGLAGFTGSLQIWNWTGSTFLLGQTDPGTNLTQDRLLFDVSTGLNGAQLGQISFFSGSGTGFLGTGSQIAFGANDFEIVPVPEPGTLLGATALLLAVGWREGRRLARLAAPRASVPLPPCGRAPETLPVSAARIPGVNRSGSSAAVPAASPWPRASSPPTHPSTSAPGEMSRPPDLGMARL